MSSIKEKYIDYCKTNETPLFFKPIWLDAINPNWDVLYKKVEEKEAFLVRARQAVIDSRAPFQQGVSL